MPPIPCIHRETACDCANVDGPFLNLSAEAPDRTIYLPRNPSDGDPPPPGLGPFYNTACATPIVSYVSQEDADTLAQAASLLCVDTPPPDPTPCDPSVEVCGPPTVPPVTAHYTSTQQHVEVECPGGGTTGYTVPAGAYTSNVNQADADAHALAIAIQKANEAPLCISTDIEGTCVGASWAVGFTASGGSGLVTWACPNVPPGFFFFADGSMSGIPAAAGNISFTLIATDTIDPARSATAVVVLRVIEITSPAVLPLITIGVPYSYTFTKANTEGLVRWFIATGAANLPPGLTLNRNTGVLSGTPTGPATGPFIIRLQDKFIPPIPDP